MRQSHTSTPVPKINGARVAILQSKWYPEFTDRMTRLCKEVLESAGAIVETHRLPGCLELPVAAKILIEEAITTLDAIVFIGVIVKGDTYHFEMIVDECGRGAGQLSLQHSIPILNAILPVTAMKQVEDRAGDNEFNKGIEAALAAAEFIAWRRNVARKAPI
jgi:6,7-dimethyl-8-ribityllumazine synthase